MAGNDRLAGQGDREGVHIGGEDPAPAPTSMADRVPPWLVFRWAVAGTAGALVVLLVAYGSYTVRGILVLVLVALFVAVSLDPAVRWLVAKGLRRPVAVTIVVLVLLVLFAAFLWSIVPPVATQGTKLFSDLPGYLNRLALASNPLRAVTDRYDLTDHLTALVAGLPARLAGGAVGLVQQFLSVLAATLTVLVLSIYFMADMPRLERGLVRLFPARRRGRVTEIVAVAVDQVGRYMIGNIVISLIAGTSAFVCLELVGVPFALPLAMTVAIADLIPMIGAMLGAAACLLVAVFTVDLWPHSVIVLLFFIAYQQVENYLIAPRVMRSTVELSAMEALLVALVGGAVLGLVGAVMAIPIAATIKVVMRPTTAGQQAAGP